MGEEGEENVQQGSRNRVGLTGGETGASADGGKGGKWWAGGVTVPGTSTPNGRVLENVAILHGSRHLCLPVSSNLYIPPAVGYD